MFARTEIAESPSQLVSRYIAGLRLQLQDVLNMFDPLTVSEAHQQALQAEEQLARRTNGGFKLVGSSSIQTPPGPA